jgi:hypothetical protein
MKFSRHGSYCQWALFGYRDRVTPILNDTEKSSGHRENLPSVVSAGIRADLRSMAIHHVSKLAATDIGCVVAYFFCDGNVHEKHDIRYVLGSVIRQMLPKLDQRHRTSAVRTTDSIYKKHRRISPNPSLLNELADLIGSFARSVSKLYVVIDGLDEISDREKSFSILGQLRLATTVKFLIVSRPLQDIERSLPEVPHIKIQADMLAHDVSTYVSWRLNNDPKLTSIQAPLKSEIEQTLLHECDGM